MDRMPPLCAGDLGLPVRIVIEADPSHLRTLTNVFGHAELRQGKAEAVWEHRRTAPLGADADLTIIWELYHMLRPLPDTEWRVDWSRSKLP